MASDTCDVLLARRSQKKEARQPQPTLFELYDDVRPALERNSADRYENPTLFDEVRHE